MKNLILLMVCSLFMFSCKEDAKKQNNTETESQGDITQKSYKDKEIEEALYDGFFVKNSEGYDISIFKDHLYLLKSDPSKVDTTAHFFLEIKTKNTQDPTLDITPQEFFYNDSLSDNFKNVAVYVYPLPKKEEGFDILVGQFNDSGRLWQTYITDQSLKTSDYQYKNEYSKNIKSNRYLDAFETALDQGYFMKHTENFDLLIHENTLYYIKQGGEPSDVETQFYLHVTYKNNPKQLITDFNAKNLLINQFLGSDYKDFIIIKKEIPTDSKILEIGTGQFNAEGRLWEVMYNLESLYDDMAFIYNDQYKTSK